MLEAGTNGYKYLRSGKVEALNNSVKFRQQEATTVQAIQTAWQLITIRASESRSARAKIHVVKHGCEQTRMQTNTGKRREVAEGRSSYKQKLFYCSTPPQKRLRFKLWMAHIEWISGFIFFYFFFLLSNNFHEMKAQKRQREQWCSRLEKIWLLNSKNYSGRRKYWIFEATYTLMKVWGSADSVPSDWHECSFDSHHLPATCEASFSSPGF